MEAGRLAPTFACKDVATDRIGSYRNVDIVLRHLASHFVHRCFFVSEGKPLRNQDVATDELN